MSDRLPSAHRHAWATAIVATIFLGVATRAWARSGSRGRSPFALRDSAVALDLYDGWLGTAIDVAWPLVPLLVGAIWGALYFSQHALMRMLAGVVAAIGMATAWAIWRSPLVQLGGSTAGVLLAALLLLLACAPTSNAPVTTE